MRQMMLVVLALISLVAGLACAGGEVFDFSDEVTKGYERPAFRAKEILKTPEYTVVALVVKEELKTHRHSDASHVLYIISGHGTVTLDGQPVALKPGTIVHIPQGVTHSVKAEGSEVTLLDFSSHTPTKWGPWRVPPGPWACVGMVIDTMGRPRYTGAQRAQPIQKDGEGRPYKGSLWLASSSQVSKRSTSDHSGRLMSTPR